MFFPPAICNPPWLPETRMTGGFCRRSVKADSQGELRRRAIYNQQQYISAMNTKLDKIVQEAALELTPSGSGRLLQDYAETILRRAIADAVRESGALQALRQVDEQTDLTSLQAFALANLRALTEDKK